MTEFYDKLWNTKYEQLVEFKRKNGHCRVPRKYQEDKSLGKWVDKQRQQFQSKNTIRNDQRTKLLEELGFVWGVDNPVQWKKQYEKLVEFKQKNGHCLVPTQYQEDVALGNWVSTQRTRHAQNKMPLDRKELLEELGFAWEGAGDPIGGNKDKIWHTQYEKLVEFKRNNGHCLVPQRYGEGVSLVGKWDVSLGRWVGRQRGRHLDNKMRLDQKKLLDELGFAWKANTIAARSSTTHVSCR
jgi:hypothetical protein